MTKEEAQLYLPWDGSDDLDDLWVEKRFEYQQFFLTRPPVAKVFRARLAKLKKLYLAFLTLSGRDLSGLNEVETKAVPKFSDRVVDAFHEWQKLRMAAKAKVLAASDYTGIAEAVQSWLKVEKCYMEKWLIDEHHLVELEVTISKEPDPMELLAELRAIEENKEALHFTQVKSNFHDLPMVIKSECKRLNLLYKKDDGGGF
jgi:hypothetical protein